MARGLLRMKSSKSCLTLSPSQEVGLVSTSYREKDREREREKERECVYVCMCVCVQLCWFVCVCLQVCVRVCGVCERELEKLRKMCVWACVREYLNLRKRQCVFVCVCVCGEYVNLRKKDGDLYSALLNHPFLLNLTCIEGQFAPNV